MNSISASDGRTIIEALIADIHANAVRLSELDGAIGDGDHGINMDKGFALAGESLPAGTLGLSEGLNVVGTTLLTEIGGAMGPLYGSFFLAMAEVGASEEEISASVFGRMLRAGREAVLEIGGASPGDKTLLDTLTPADAAFDAALGSGASFGDALAAMAEAAERGVESTREMVARVGRASRLGERSRGSIDAGAASCAVILGSLARSMRARLSIVV